jgi:TPR repeat protein
MFVPLVNMVMPFVLGVKGSAWAWRNKQWQDVDHFKRVQRKWAIWGIVAWIAIVGFFGVLYFSVSAALKNSEAYKMAVTQLLANSEAINALGTPISTGNPMGKIETSGPTGKADLSFSVEGPKAKGTVNLDATKDLGVWKLNRIELQIDGRAGRINLAEGAARASIEEGLAAAKSGDYATALRLWRSAADQGIAAAQFNLGLMYRLGQGVPQNDAEAVKWFQKAAEQGYANAQYDLAVMHVNGRGLPKNFAEAIKWYRRAAEQRHARAQLNCAIMYENARGVPQNLTEALTWYRKAAEQGNATAQNNLGVMSDNARGVPQNFAEALKWYRLAADQANATAQNNLGIMYENARGVPQDHAEALKWFQKSAEQGNARAQNNLAVMY